MTEEKVRRFFDLAMDKTKMGSMTWTRINSVESNALFEDVDNERSFVSKHGLGKIYLLKGESDDSVSCYIKPDRDLSPQQIGDDDDPILLRLYNIVYSRFPSVDSFVDDFLLGIMPDKGIDK